MKLQKKQLSTAIALALMLTIVATLITFLPTTVFAAIGRLPSGATVEMPAESHAFLYLRPNPIGVGQTLLINGWVSPPNHRYADYLITPPVAIPPLRQESSSNSVPRPNNHLIVTSPAGTVEDIGPFMTDGSGFFWLTYVPTTVGTWYFQFTWPGDAYFQAASTEKQPLIVQQEPIPQWPGSPLPTEPWSYPVSYENREWVSISGNWYSSGYDDSEHNFNPYTQAPDSAHILWKNPSLTGVGGLIGGQYGTTGYYDASATGISVVMAGKAYSSSGGQIWCFDAESGKLLWNRTGSYNYGDIWGSFTQQAVLGRTTVGKTGTPALLSFGTRFIVYDALTGAVIQNVTGMSVFGYDGTFAYTSQSSGRSSPPYDFIIKWWLNGTTNTFANRIVWNITNPAISNRGGGLYHTTFSDVSDVMAEISYSIYGESFGLNTTTGATLWKANLTTPVWPTSGGSIGSYMGDEIFPVHTRKLCSMDMATGVVNWLSEQADYPWGDLFAYSNTAGYGLIIRGTYDGLYAWNATNGKIVWHYRQEDTHMETPYGNYPFYGGPKLADGKFYMNTYEHSPSLPIYRGQRLACFNAYTGENLWSILGTFSASAVANGKLFTTSTYDGKTYAFGKGEVAMTVSATPKLASLGQQVLIEGSIMDQSPAQPNTPAMSDASMGNWMEYLHVQQPFPKNATGVEVSLDTFDPNGNNVHIGTVTSDQTGKYSFLWTPQIEGKHTVIASFAGTKSYYAAQCQETAVGISPAPAATSTSDQPTTSAPDLTFTIVGATIAIIIALAIVALLLLRKRP